MRQLLVDAARRRAAGKRGSGAFVIPLHDADGCLASNAEEVLALNTALDELSRLNPRQALMVEARFLGTIII
jgi:hypothetical protein